MTKEEKKMLKPLLDPSRGDEMVSKISMDLMQAGPSGGEDSFVDAPFGNSNNNDFYYFDDYDKPKISGTYIRKEIKVGRNDPCPCGSGKKYKKCCLK